MHLQITMNFSKTNSISFKYKYISSLSCLLLINYILFFLTKDVDSL